MEKYCNDCNNIINDDSYFNFGAFIYCSNCNKKYISEDIDEYFGLKYIKDILYIEKELNRYLYLEYVSDIVNIENMILNNIMKPKWDWSLLFPKPEREYLLEEYILHNIDLDIYNYYNNKYKDYNLTELVKENMKIGGLELCDEYYCYNFKENGEDLCIQCIEAQQTTEEEILKHNINRFHKNIQNKYKLYLNRKI
jgi:hypothetical protein